MSDFGGGAPPPPPPPSAGGDPGIPMAPKRPGQIISGAFAAFGEHWKQLILFSIVYVVAFIVLTFVLVLMFVALFESVTGVAVTIILAIGLFFVFSFAFTGAITRLVATDLADEPIGVRDSISFGMRHLGPIALVSFLVFLVFLLVGVVGILLAAALDAVAIVLLVVLVALFIALTLSMAIPALVIEGAHGTAALTRSWELVLANFWHALGTFALLYLIIIGLSIAIDIVSEISAALGGLLNLGLQLFTLPFTSLVTVSLYLNLRVRSGGVTKESLREELRRGA